MLNKIIDFFMICAAAYGILMLGVALGSLFAYLVAWFIIQASHGA